MNTEISIKPLEVADLDGVAIIHLKAFPRSLLTALGKEAVIRYYAWCLLGPHDVVALGLFHNKSLKGYCYGEIFENAMKGYLYKHRLFLLKCLILNPSIFFQQEFRNKILKGMSILFSKIIAKKSIKNKYNKNKKSFGILAIAVDPYYQRLGYGKLLMEHIETIAIYKGYNKMHLIVDISNITAIFFYERLGWRKILNKDDHFSGLMVKSLC
jgi:ribosomal protein S18 acetylase RimI-like enzyme